MKKIPLFILLLLVLGFTGCATHMHTIGQGAQGNDVTEARQWYVLFGLVPLNTVDTHDMADGAKDYTITTESSALDLLMNVFTWEVSVMSRTVTVTK